MKEREELVRQMKLQPEVTSEEVASLFNDGSIGMRLLGQLLRNEDEARGNILNFDLVSEEGRLRALQAQGELKGRALLLESILDLIIQGSDDGRPSEQ